MTVIQYKHIEILKFLTLSLFFKSLCFCEPILSLYIIIKYELSLGFRGNLLTTNFIIVLHNYVKVALYIKNV